MEITIFISRRSLANASAGTISNPLFTTHNNLQFDSLDFYSLLRFQAGYSTNLDPAKLVGKLFTSIDRSIHRMIGTTPMPQSGTNGKEYNYVAPKVANSQSTMAMSSLIPSSSQENLNDWAINSRTMHSRSASEPDFGKALKQVDSFLQHFSYSNTNFIVNVYTTFLTMFHVEFVEFYCEPSTLHSGEIYGFNLT